MTMTLTLNAEAQEILERAMSFPMDMVLITYAEKQEIPLEIAREHERELKRYLGLCAMKPGVVYGMKGPIDQLWHEFVLFTEQYEMFCNSVSGRFLHHRPHVPGLMDDKESANNYQRFLADYEATYGESAPPDLWPRAGNDPIDPLLEGPVPSVCGCTGPPCAGRCVAQS
ncbi:MAG TPA: hypothetical protein VI306_09650 [Pyrinomonadaceae bacterium]